MKRNTVIPRQKSLAVPDVPNPFVHELKLSFWDKLQIAVMSVTVAPLRLLLILFFLILAWAFAAIAISFRSKEDLKKPLAGWRLWLRPVVLFFCRAVFFTGGMCWITQKGKQASAKEAPILLLAPHSTYLDALPAVYLGLTSVVTKQSNVGLVFFGTLTKFSQPVLVDRTDPDSRANTIREIQRRGHSGGQWPQIIIFPEGTCSNRACLISFKQGAFFPGVPVQPVCISYPNKLDTVTWTWEGPGALTQLWLTLCQFYTRVEVEYLPVYTPNEEEKNDPKLFANNVRAVMAMALKVPVTDHTYDDCRLMSKAEKLHMPAEAGIVEFEKLHSKLGVRFEQVQELLVKFKDMKKSGSKKGAAAITYEDFGNYLHLPPSEPLQQVFEMYDRDGSGTIDFREYIIGLSLVSSPANSDGSIELAFQLFDVDNKGYVTQENLQQLLGGAFNIQEDQVEIIFQEIDTKGEGKITKDEFKAYAEKKPELASIFQTYRDLKAQRDSVEEAGSNPIGSSNGHVVEGDEFGCDSPTLKKRRENPSQD